MCKDVQSTHAEDGADLDKQLAEISTAVTSSRVEQKQILANLAALESTTTLQDLKLLSMELEMAVGNLEARLSNLRSGNFTPVTQHEKEVNEKRDSKIKRVLRNRRDIHREEWSVVCEHFLAEGETAAVLWVSSRLKYFAYGESAHRRRWAYKSYLDVNLPGLIATWFTTCSRSWVAGSPKAQSLLCRHISG
jgi:hypothetical protein